MGVPAGYAEPVAPAVRAAYQTDATTGQAQDGTADDFVIGREAQIDRGSGGRAIARQTEPSIHAAWAQPLDQHRTIVATDAGYVAWPRPMEPAVSPQQHMVAIVERRRHAAAAHADDAPAEPAPRGPLRARDRRPPGSAGTDTAASRSLCPSSPSRSRRSGSRGRQASGRRPGARPACTRCQPS